MRDFNITAITFNDKTENDNRAYTELTDTAKKVYDFFEVLTKINPKNTWTLDIEDCSSRSKLTVEEFIQGAKELCEQDYFMYRDLCANKYVFGTSRMVF